MFSSKGSTDAVCRVLFFNYIIFIRQILSAVGMSCPGVGIVWSAYWMSLRRAHCTWDVHVPPVEDSNVLSVTINS